MYPPGMYRVRIDIQPGLYEGHARCYWQRLDGPSGESKDRITSDFTDEDDGRFFVEILPTDKYFKFEHRSVRLVSESE